jgi:uncharacterized protein (TIGR03437 family)
MVSAAFAQNAQTINIVATTNSADFHPGLPQPGSLCSLFVTGLQGSPGIVTPPTVPLPSELAGVSVWIDSRPAPILAIAFFDSYQQINLQVPWEVPGNNSLTVSVAQNGVSAQSDEPVNGYLLQPSVFFADAKGYGFFQRATDYSRVTPDNPVHPGEYVIGYAINLGPVTHTPATGDPAPFDPLAVPTAVPPVCSMMDSIRWGATNQAPLEVAPPLFVGLAPGKVGVYQVNFQVPQSVALGDIPISFVRNLQENTFSCPGFGSQTELITLESPTVLLPVR